MCLSIDYSSHMNFGDTTTAQAAVDFYLASRGQGVEENDEWRTLGYGCSRTALLHKSSQVVYKVLHFDGDGDNERELAASVRLRKFVWEAVYVPRIEGYQTTKGLTLAVEYIDAPLGQETPSAGASKGRHELMLKGRFADMHGMNFLVLNDTVIPIDMGHPSGDEVINPDNRCLTAGDGRWW